MGLSIRVSMFIRVDNPYEFISTGAWDWDLFPVHTFQITYEGVLLDVVARAETSELTEGKHVGGDAQGLPECSNPSIFGKFIISFPLKFLSQPLSFERERFHRSPMPCGKGWQTALVESPFGRPNLCQGIGPGLLGMIKRNPFTGVD